ncbi:MULTISPECIES: AAA family ATPase [Pseudomonadaceae]|uniref:Pathogenesis related protein n=4 Tax=Pseudomonadaceae TaxID=135621 RepID=A0A6F8PA82_PSEAI|nr:MULTISPECIES: AAA family ATPase [Pseudomonadaceae]BBJ01383.1 pathogenesis related protein [Pseudomonas abietaniphila]BBJ01508.1 pathogenesis related protein [Pseudomonas aeruginosa]
MRQLSWEGALMKIKFVEISNFRRLKSTHLDFDKETTIFVGANNSGKTSAMVALRYFLVSPNRLALRDITIANWPKIDAIGDAWENGAAGEVNHQ